MADLQKGRRIVDATDLFRKISALKRVGSDARPGLIHDQLMEAIDDICAKQRGTGPALFNQKQVAVIKDVSFYIVHILDKRNAPPDGLIGKTWHEFRGAGLPSKIAMIAGVVGILTALAGGGGWIYGRIVGGGALQSSVTQASMPSQIQDDQNPMAKQDKLPAE